ncbi:hypothetical protein HZS55_15720 [Halosimplex rubrum]|uniref:ArsR family transcriptional regulator n=1 Tax=Halosimplex rubrum TaxID=869889 RepID=A0A7D5TPW5_9EURY|nr:hypothetical protein HZS55_15720 [Halosimplex rubrum]
MKLKRPVDFEILGAYSDGEQDVGVNIAERIDYNRSYVNTRLPQLEDYGLLTKVGPSERSGLYRITPKGVAALRLRNEYGEEGYEELVDERAAPIEVHRPRITGDEF